MTNHVIDNSLKNIGKVVLWQYDNAFHLLLLLKYLKELYEAATLRFWSYWNDSILSIDTCSDIGAAVWGILLGASRPVIEYEELGTKVKRPVDLTTYRKIIKARYVFLLSNGSIQSLSDFIRIIFTPDGIDKKCGIKIVDNLDMSLSFGKSEYFDQMSFDQQLLYNQHIMDIFPYPLGIGFNEPVPERVFGFAGQENEKYSAGRAYSKLAVVGVEESDEEYYNWECQEDISASENTSWDDVKSKFRKVFYGDPFVGGFSNDTPEYEYKAGITIWVGVPLSHNGEVWIPQTTFASSGVWEVDKSKMTKAWQDTTFICQHTLSELKISGLEYSLVFKNPSGLPVASYNGLADTTVTYGDIMKAFMATGAMTIASGNKLKVSLDAAAAAEGKTIHSDATIGDIMRYLNGTL